MLVPETDPAAKTQLLERSASVPSADAFLDAVKTHTRLFRIATEESGMVVQAVESVDGRPNRAAIKIFAVQDGPQAGQDAVFFFKRSRVPFSRDRFSYGVCMTAGADAAAMAAWLDYAASGFDPDLAPRALRKAFTFTVP